MILGKISGVSWMIFASVLPLCASVQSSSAQDPNAIIQSQSMHFDVDGPGKATMRVAREILILGPAGRHHGVIPVYYDDLRKLKKFSGTLTNDDGKVVGKLNRDNTEDRSAVSAASFYDDSRVRIGTLVSDDYPYVVSYEYELLYDGVSHWPTWYPQETEAAVLNSEFVVTVPDDMDVRYWNRNTDLEPQITQNRRRVEYRWSTAMRGVFTAEPWGPPLEEQLPAVVTAPGLFEVDGYRGNMTTWAGLSFWYSELIEGRAEVPQQLAADVQYLVRDASSNEEKARLVYKFVQDRTRYVSVQLGIGSWQPYDVIYVDKNGFGDCKALVNYTQALLGVAGVEAYPALIRNGLRLSEMSPDFPCNPFNHVILYLPNDGDPLWLEATSQTIAFGRIGASNEDRWALVAFPDGGKLVRTPTSQAEDNFLSRNANVALDAAGNATVVVDARFGGSQQDYVTGNILQLDDAGRMDWLRDYLPLPSLDLVDVDLSDVQAGQEVVGFKMGVFVSGYARRSGRRFFFVPSMLDRVESTPPPIEGERTQPVRFSYRFLDTDSTTFLLPDGYKVEALPEPIEYETEFGRYVERSTLRDDGSLLHTRILEIRETEVPAENYEEVRILYSLAATGNRNQVVLVKSG